VRAGLVLIVVITNIIALLSVLGARIGSARRLAWVAAILLLPLIGAFMWFARGRSR
jgi:hypothetical protein